MKPGYLTATSLLLALWQTPALAQMSIRERLENMEKRLEFLEKRVADQDRVIEEKNRQLRALSKVTEEKVTDKKVTEESESAWFRKVKLHGTVELEANHTDPFAGQSTSDLTVATAEIGLTARVHDWVGAEITLLHEEDETNLEVDVATIVVAPPDGPWFLIGGQFYVPFGTYETSMISDPLTLEVGETRETALQFGIAKNGFSASLYAFNGTNRNGGENRIDNFGAALGYAGETGRVTYAVNASYINDIGDSDNLQTAIADSIGSNNVANHVGGWSAGGRLGFRPFTLMAEYLAATDEFAANEVGFAGRGARPEAWQIEAAYSFTVLEKETTFAVSYQGTDEALALDLPETRYLTALRMEVNEHLGVGVEWAHDRDYGTADGGTGNEADTLTAQLAVGF